MLTNGLSRTARLLMAALVTLAAHAAVIPVTFNAPLSFRVPVGINSEESLVVAVADFNGDGKPDMAVAGANQLSVMLGDGTGNFSSKASYNFAVQGVFGYSIAVADFNGDGKLDLVITGNNINGGVSVLLGNGDGTFQAPVALNSGGRAISVAVGDFNGDGVPDLAVTNTGGPGYLGILLGNGDGTFQPRVTYQVGNLTNPECCLVAIGDFNGDGHPDVVVLNPASPSYSILLGNGDGTFQLAVSYPGGGEAVVVADFNGDGNLDLAILSGPDVSLLPGNGDGTFQSPQTVSIGGPGSSLALTNLNGEIGFVAMTQNGISVVMGNGDGTFQPPVLYPLDGQSVDFVTAADLNGDGIPDVVAGSIGGQVGVLLSNKDGVLPQTTTYATGRMPTAVVVGDWNGDGRPDLAVANFGSSDVSILLGNADGSFRPQVKYPAGSNPYSIAAADLNGDGKLDLVVGSKHSTSVSVLLGNGDGTFHAAVNYVAGAKPYSVAVGDVNGDGKPDLVVSTGANIAVLLGNGDGTFASARLYPTISKATVACVALGDFNGDGKLDVAVSYIKGPLANPSNYYAILPGNGDGTFRAAIPGTRLGNYTYAPLTVADFNGDGIADLVVNALGMEVLLGKGDGTFKKGTVYPLHGTQSYVVADFDGDGKPDIAAAGQQNGVVSLLLGNGSHAPVLQFGNNMVGGTVGFAGGGIGAGDFNGDGKLDVAVPNYLFNSVSVLLNTTP